MPLDSTLAPGKDGMYHVSFVGHFSQMQLRLALQHPDMGELQQQFASCVIGRSMDVLDELDPAPSANVIMLTLQLFHSRQDGFSDEELDKLGDLFACIPYQVSCWLIDSPFDPITFICEPIWQLMSPDMQVKRMYWDLDDHDTVTAVATLSDLCRV